MNKQQYEALNEEHKQLAKEAYIDGFKACLEQVKSTQVRVGDEVVDKMFEQNRNMIASSLLSTIDKMEK